MRNCLYGLATVLMLAAICVRADEEKVPLDKVPKAVTDAVKKKFPKAELTGASKEKEDGKDVYEVSIKAEDTTIDVTVTPEGKIVLIEKIIKLEKVPKAVADAVAAKYPKATLKQVEEISKDDKIIKYEYLLVTADKKTLEVSFDPAGKFLEEEKKEEEKKEPKKEEKKQTRNDEQGSRGQFVNVLLADKSDKKNKKDEDDDEKDSRKKNAKKEDDKDEKKAKGKKEDNKDEKGQKGDNQGENDDEKKGKGKKGDEKSVPKMIDLSKLPPDVAKKILALIEQSKKSEKKDEKDEKKSKKKGEDDDKDEKKSKKKKDD